MSLALTNLITIGVVLGLVCLAFLYRKLHQGKNRAHASNVVTKEPEIEHTTKVDEVTAKLESPPKPGTFFPDQPAPTDCLDFESYANTLATLLAAEETQTPLTLGIFGAWGSGKTTLMRMIESTLKEIEKQSGNNRFVVVRFDAWKYYKEDALWRAMLLRVLDVLRTEKSNSEMSPENLSRQVERLEQGLYRDVEWEEKSGLTIDWPKLISAGAGGALKLSFAFVPGLSTLVKAVEAAHSSIGGGKLAEDVSALADAFKRDVVKYHQSQLRHIEQFQFQFSQLVREHFAGQRLVVFIDDLDRCLPEKAIEVLEAVKLFLDVEGCIFVLGIDEQVISRGLELRYKDLAATPGVITSHYVEKIIQLPFSLPPIEPADMQSYVKSFNADWPSTDCVEIFADGLAPNPRQVKRTINVFMLLWKLAEMRRERIGKAVTPLRLAKVVVLQTAHPKLFEHLKGNPSLLRTLEQLCLGAPDIAVDGILQEAAQQPTVRKLFQFFPENELAGFAAVSLEELAGFFSLARRAPIVADTVTTAETAEQTATSVPAIEKPEDVYSRAMFQLRPAVRDFVGRTEEVKTLVNSIRSGTSVGFITGMAGIGKTELALLAADQLKPDFPDGQLFVNLRGTDEHPRDAAEALASCIRAFVGPQKTLPTDLQELGALYRNYLEGKRTLILLDNAADPVQVSELTPPRGSVMIVTSRNSLTVPGMIKVTLGQLSSDEAVQLLSWIAPRTPPDVAAEISKLCGYFPPAVRIAASTLESTPDLDPSNYVERLRDEQTRLELIGDGAIDTKLEASFSLSYKGLAPETGRIFRSLAVFPASFTAAAEEVICSDPSHAQLSVLVKHSQVMYEEAQQRYSLHSLVRLFALQQLSAEEKLQVSKLHAVYYLDIIRRADELYRGGEPTLAQGLLLLDLEWSNITAGFNWASQNHDGDLEVAKLCSDYASLGAALLELRLTPRQHTDWILKALTAAELVADKNQISIHLLNLGLAHSKLGALDVSIDYLQRALAITREIGDRRNEGLVLTNLGLVHRDLGEFDKATNYYREHLKIARDLGDHRGESVALINLGNALAASSNYLEAARFYEESLSLINAANDLRTEGVVLGNLGAVHQQVGEIARAYGYYERQLAIALKLGDATAEATARYNRSLLLIRLKDPVKALEEMKQALQIYEQLESPISNKVRDQLRKLEELKNRSPTSA